MANAIYIDNGTAVTFDGTAGADVAFSIEGLASGAGRVSAQKDWGVTPRAFSYTLDVDIASGAGTQYTTVDFYIAEAYDGDNTQIAGDVGVSDAALGSTDQTRNLKYVGSVIQETQATAEDLKGSFTFTSYARYWSLVAVNNTGATLDATDSNHNIYVTPKFIEVQ